MFTAFLNRTSGFVIAGLTVEWRRLARAQYELMMRGEHERGGLLFSKDKTGAGTSTL